MRAKDFLIAVGCCLAGGIGITGWVIGLFFLVILTGCTDDCAYMDSYAQAIQQCMDAAPRCVVTTDEMMYLRSRQRNCK